jgi:hypothetical protein
VEHVEEPAPGEHLVVKVLSIINTSDMEFMNFWPIGDLLYTRISGSWLNEAFERVINRILDEFQRMEVAYTVRVKAISLNSNPIWCNTWTRTAKKAPPTSSTST